MGDRVARSSVLSDPVLIERINREFNAVLLNVTDVGFPAWMKAILPWKAVYDSNMGAQAAFANVAVIDPDGRYVLSTGDSGKIPRSPKQFSMNYDPPRFTTILDRALEVNARLEGIRNDQALDTVARDAKLAAIEAEVDRDIERNYKTEPFFMEVVRNLRKQQAATP